MQYNWINFIYGVHTLDLSEPQILEKLLNCPNIVSLDLISYLYSENNIGITSISTLYNKKIIDIELFKKFSEKNDIKSEIDIQKIQEKYLKIKKSNKSEDEITDLDTMIEFYKIINLDDKEKEEIEEESDNIMYELAENFEEEDILFYYEKGLLTLRTIAEGGGESIIKKLYYESLNN